MHGGALFPATLCVVTWAFGKCYFSQTALLLSNGTMTHVIALLLSPAMTARPFLISNGGELFA